MIITLKCYYFTRFWSTIQSLWGLHHASLLYRFLFFKNICFFELGALESGESQFSEVAIQGPLVLLSCSCVGGGSRINLGLILKIIHFNFFILFTFFILSNLSVYKFILFILNLSFFIQNYPFYVILFILFCPLLSFFILSNLSFFMLSFFILFYPFLSFQIYQFLKLPFFILLVVLFGWWSPKKPVNSANTLVEAPKKVVDGTNRLVEVPTSW